MSSYGLYIHIPFCYKKCFYCNFFSRKYNSILADQYVEALSIHIRKIKNKKINSIYIGGGTPSSLSYKQMEKLLLLINRTFNLKKILEFTVELNPETASKEILHLLNNEGVNRLSFGLQSTDDRALKLLGRTHNFQTFCKCYENARKEGFDNINIDLIYGFQNQTINNLKDSLNKVFLFNSEHLSIYPMSIENNTHFHNKKVSLNTELQKNMYNIIVDLLSKKKYIQYEISNWSKYNKHSIHNINYWYNKEYIGIGAGASGYFNRIRYKNITNIKKYIKLIKSYKEVKSEKEYINKKLHNTEAIILGLRLLKEGVDIKCFNSLKYQNILKKCLRYKFLERNGNRIKLNKKYVFVSNQIIIKFL
ncbi:MAG: radical SAM family heme chaperone HemW [Endomicrobium sp.]|jgi:oxygen-independent coproporphyrinogen-3 oxidase|nr:radical SAM family heme chaperone HemW [Endomicrobium sp.]